MDNPVPKLRPLPKIQSDWLQSAPSRALKKLFDQTDYTARFVGGVVRNALLDEPVNDLDLATDARPEWVMKMALDAGFKAIGTGLEHGTVTLVIDHQSYEITTLRVDMETDGRHATVRFTDDWHQDAARRDFTMNALYVGFDGEIFDPLGGYDDVIHRRVRFIGSASDRIREDALRIMRFFRFNAQYGGGRVDGPGLEACVKLRDMLSFLSAERIRSELLRLLLMPRAPEVLEVMFAHGLLLPLAARVPHMGRLEKWIELERELQQTLSSMNRLGALFVLVAEDATWLAQRLRLSNEEQRTLKNWGSERRIAGDLCEKEARKARYQFADSYQMRVAISWLLSNAGHGNKAWRNLYDLPLRGPPPIFPVQGRDLLEQGHQPGPLIGKKLKKLEQVWIDSDFSLNKDALFEHLNPKP